MADKKKISIIAGSFVLVAAVVACVVAFVGNNKPDNNNAQMAGQSSGSAVSTSVKSIESICQPTGYKQTCEDELSKAAGNNTDMKSLFKAALEVPVNYLKDAYNHSAVLAAAAKDPTNSGPLQNCNTLFGYAIDDLEDVIDQFMGYELPEMYKVVYDIRTWISSACTFQYDCLDGFQNTTNEGAEAMKKALNISIQMSSNALTIASKLENMVGELNISELLGGAGFNRRLLTTDSSWLSQGGRRLLQLAPWQMKPIVTVAKDGSGQFKTITEGIAAMPRNNKDYVVMYVKEGVYEEKVTVDRKLNKLVIIGDGPTKTRVTGKLNVMMGGGLGTFRTSTFAVIGDEFIAKDMGFENTAGPEGHQAVAFRSQSDKSVLYNCHFDGYQDTLYAHTKRQFYRDCTISGTVDFIFGDSISIFQNCKMIVRKPMANQQNIVTAHGSKEPTSPTIFILHNSTITAEPALVPLIAANPSYLGRPWKPYARTVIMQSEIDNLINSDGWMPWAGEPDSINTCYYAEIDNRGPGADRTKRVKWPGVHDLTTKDAEKYTVEHYFQEVEWPRTTGVPLIAGLLPSTQPHR